MHAKSSFKASNYFRSDDWCQNSIQDLSFCYQELVAEKCLELMSDWKNKIKTKDKKKDIINFKHYMTGEFEAMKSSPFVEVKKLKR